MADKPKEMSLLDQLRRGISDFGFDAPKLAQREEAGKAPTRPKDEREAVWSRVKPGGAGFRDVGAGEWKNEMKNMELADVLQLLRSSKDYSPEERQALVDTLVQPALQDPTQGYQEGLAPFYRAAGGFDIPKEHFAPYPSQELLLGTAGAVAGSAAMGIPTEAQIPLPGGRQMPVSDYPMQQDIAFDEMRQLSNVEQMNDALLANTSMGREVAGEMVGGGGGTGTPTPAGATGTPTGAGGNPLGVGELDPGVTGPNPQAVVAGKIKQQLAGQVKKSSARRLAKLLGRGFAKGSGAMFGAALGGLMEGTNFEAGVAQIGETSERNDMLLRLLSGLEEQGAQVSTQGPEPAPYVSETKEPQEEQQSLGMRLLQGSPAAGFAAALTGRR